MRRGLYIHIPFCKQKCNYCNFSSFAGQTDHIDAYLQALAREAAQHKGTRCNTLYVGGGTPSLLTQDQLGRLAEMICQNFQPVGDFVESTLEANPESLTPGKISTLRKLGFGRLSMGLQSFHDEELKQLGRVHTVGRFLQVYQVARQCGFTNINVDLIAGLPGQRVSYFMDSVERLLQLRPEHISVYGLEIEEGTPFFAQGVVCDQARMRTMLEETHRLLTDSGYEHYEISNYALPGKRAQHNTNYWQNGEYLGLGSAAASYQKGHRRQNTSSLTAYITCMQAGKTPVVFTEKLTGKAQVGETLMLALRQLDGVELTNKQQNLFGTAIQRHIQNGLLTQVDKKVKLSEQGLYLANEVFRSFVAPFEDA